MFLAFFFFFQAEDGIRDIGVTGVQTCALPIYPTTPIGSRRIVEVCSPEYSALALPSRVRAAPAKKETLSTVPGTSKPWVSRIGLPACRLSAVASSPATASSSAASRCIAVDRSAGVAPAQPGNAAFAAATASSTSSTEARVSVATTSPLEGLVTVRGSDELPRRRRPSMNCWPVSSIGEDVAADVAADMVLLDRKSVG